MSWFSYGAGYHAGLQEGMNRPVVSYGPGGSIFVVDYVIAGAAVGIAVGLHVHTIAGWCAGFAIFFGLYRATQALKSLAAVSGLVFSIAYGVLGFAVAKLGKVDPLWTAFLSLLFFGISARLHYVSYREWMKGIQTEPWRYKGMLE